jgi:hypothetical protein
MCKVVLRKNQQVRVIPLECSTDADWLYVQAVEQVRFFGDAYRLDAIEPCFAALSMAVAPRPERVAR